MIHCAAYARVRCPSVCPTVYGTHNCTTVIWSTPDGSIGHELSPTC